MGAVKRLLHQSKISPSPDMYPKSRSIEAAESMHIHERNVRLEYDVDEFFMLLGDLSDAHTTWSGDLSEKTRWLKVSDIGNEPAVTPTRFEIEESEYPTLDQTTIHLHYRNLRIEFSHREWEDFAEGVIDAMTKWSDK